MNQNQPKLTWRKATASGHNGGCAEVAASGGMVLLRDSKDPHGTVLAFTPHEWACFLDGARKGEFDGLAQGATP